MADFSRRTKQGESSPACSSCGRQPIGSYRPIPTRKYLCPYCNETAVLRDEGVVVDSFTNVCHEACLEKALRG